jgi:hypothetical protein
VVSDQFTEKPYRLGRQGRKGKEKLYREEYNNKNKSKT